MEQFRIHGDNVVECERIAKLVLDEIGMPNAECSLISPSTISYNACFQYENKLFDWQIELLPGFNKNGRKRWSGDIFDGLRESGSFLDETPDAIVTRVQGEEETILFAIELCSALQAGNQAWQRSGRAFSTGRTGCPYIYIVDFVKYELDNKTRSRKALRFPNPAVPYSYISFSRQEHLFTAQAYVKSEEFNKADKSLIDFDESNFTELELARFIVKIMAKLDTNAERKSILDKNFNVVRFLSHGANPNTSLTEEQWIELYHSGEDILEYSISKASFPFHKKIAAKSLHGNSGMLVELVQKFSIGIGSKDLPFGVIQGNRRSKFTNELKKIYPDFNTKTMLSIEQGEKHLLVCMLKGFKPRGDDNRPDRGALPLATMLSSDKADVLTFIYGPILSRNLSRLLESPRTLADSNGLWKSILALSDYVLIDSPILHSKTDTDACALVDSRELKQHYLSLGAGRTVLTKSAFSSSPNEYHEDDVDTGIHYLFAHVMHNECFEGMCNPPGGDWSGMSVVVDNNEYRWLSLPRVSEEVAGKRPDHVVELFGLGPMPVLLTIESKERSVDLETNVGNGLVNYIKHLASFVPSVTREREGRGMSSAWSIAKEAIDINQFEIVSAAAYLESSAQDDDVVFENSACDLLIVLTPLEAGWRMRMVPGTPQASSIKQFIKAALHEKRIMDIDLI